MDFSQVNWLNVGFAVSGVCVLAFAAAAFKRQWSVAALLVGLIHLPIVFVNSAAPFRGAFDPTYVGYNLGLIHADKGIEVAIFGLAVVAGGFASAYIAVLNQPGERNYFIVAFDSFLLLIWLPSTISTVIDRGLESFRVELGEFLQFSGFPAMLF